MILEVPGQLRDHRVGGYVHHHHAVVGGHLLIELVVDPAGTSLTHTYNGVLAHCE